MVTTTSVALSGLWVALVLWGTRLAFHTRPSEAYNVSMILIALAAAVTAIDSEEFPVPRIRSCSIVQIETLEPFSSRSSTVRWYVQSSLEIAEIGGRDPWTNWVQFAWQGFVVCLSFRELLEIFQICLAEWLDRNCPFSLQKSCFSSLSIIQWLSRVVLYKCFRCSPTNCKKMTTSAR